MILDELHLILRITDVLLRNLLDDANDKDAETEMINDPAAKGTPVT